MSATAVITIAGCALVGLYLLYALLRGEEL
jgi:hypothetical protein